MNFLRVVLSIGKGFSIILRTRINLLIGKRSQSTAENFFWYFYSSILVTGCLFGLITCTSSHWIASIYTVNPQVQETISNMIFMVSFSLFMVLSLDSVSTVMRSLWKSSTLISIYIFVLIFFNAVLGWNLMKRFQMFAYGLSISTAFSIAMCNLCCLFSLSTTDWSVVDSKYKEYKKCSELLRRLTAIQTGKQTDMGIRFSTNGVPMELLVLK